MVLGGPLSLSIAEAQCSLQGLTTQAIAIARFVAEAPAEFNMRLRANIRLRGKRIG